MVEGRAWRTVNVARAPCLVRLECRGREHWRREAGDAGVRVRALYGADTVVSALEAVYDRVVGRALQASA